MKKIPLFYRVCIIGAVITIVFTIALTFAGIPYYMTGHLVLPWIVAMMAKKMLLK